tara:strand:- start:444 stop:560 length:117 start_codon:yes stop_codon:yes gene_type:complete
MYGKKTKSIKIKSKKPKKKSMKSTAAKVRKSYNRGKTR